MKKIFLISPIANATPEETAKIEAYAASLEAQGHQVYVPHLHTNQKDPTGGHTICKTNAGIIMICDEVHVWYSETSGGSKFDIGVAFTFIVILGYKKKFVIANDHEVTCEKEKSFLQVLRYHIANYQKD